MTVADAFAGLVASGALDLQPPAGGATGERLRRLFEIGRDDVAVARLAEAHADALAILGEAGRTPRPRTAYGVWAADDPSAHLELAGASGSGPLRLRGTKAFGTGLGLVDRALVTVRRDTGVVLVDVDVRRSETVAHDASGWVTDAFAATNTGTIRFTDHPVEADQVVGAADWYLERVGFWHGACGPAACWAGGAAGLVDWVESAARAGSANPHRDAHVGALVTLRWRMTAELATAGAEADAAPHDRPAAMIRALMLRHDIERAATEILDRTGRAYGPRPLAFDGAVSRRMSEVQLYIRQDHAERDLEALGRAIRDPP